MKNKIIIEGKEFELPDELVNKIKEELNKSKKVTYEDVFRTLRDTNPSITSSHYAFSLKQQQKLEAINKLMNVAKYLNGDWKAKRGNPNYMIYLNSNDNVGISYYVDWNASFVYFKNNELAQEAVSILGEDTIKLALSTDW